VALASADAGRSSARSQPTGGERKFISDKAPAITARRTKLSRRAREREKLLLCCIWVQLALGMKKAKASESEAWANDNEIADLFIDRIDPSSRHCLVS